MSNEQAITRNCELYICNVVSTEIYSQQVCERHKSILLIRDDYIPDSESNYKGRVYKFLKLTSELP
jgi:hypothetical protein